MIDQSQILFVFAMPEEAQDYFSANDINVVYTGLGKVNAAYRLTSELGRLKSLGRRIELVVNFGTAGSSVFATHQLVECADFVQRDMDVSPLGFAVGETPFEKMPSLIRFPRRFLDLPIGVCGSGDSFEIGARAKVNCDVVDMEAYAFAKVCNFEGLAFHCFKYITDGADQNAHGDWRENLKFAAKKFGEIHLRLLQE